MSRLVTYQPATTTLPAGAATRDEHGHPTFTLTIDGRVLQAYEGQTILSVAIDNGIQDIPNLCNDEKLEPTSACRMCLVHIKGQKRPLPSCNMPAQPGMVIKTNSDELFHIRRTNLEMMLSDHNAYCQPPCQVECPTHIDIPGYLELIAQGSMKEAARLVKEVLPFPYILGLTCPAPCQDGCRRKLVDEEIAICRMHGHAAETCLLDPPVPYEKDPATGKRIAIVGAGPAGLSCAYYLALRGHYVKVFDKQPQPGGMLRYGIPEYRLQKDMMDRELQHVFDLGVDLQANIELGRDFTVDDLFAQGFDAVYLAIGCWTSNQLRIPGEDAHGVVNAIKFLYDKVEGKATPVKEGNEVVVIGGGFTTFDCTRTALRLGARVHTTYYRTRKDMTATNEEIEDGEAEGTHLLVGAAQQRVLTENGRVVGVEYARTRPGEPDASGRRRPVPIPGSEFVIPCDTLIPAIGQKVDTSVLNERAGVQWTKWKTIQTNPFNFMTDRYGVFAGGDCQLGASTIIQCVAQGKLGARSIHAFLLGEDMDEIAHRLEMEERKPDLFDIVPYKPVEPRIKMSMLPYEERKHNFSIIEMGYLQEQAQREAARCLQCACPATGQCDLQRYSIEHGLADNRFHDGEPSDYHDYETDLSHSFILRDPNKCINCTQCVRVCHDVIGPDCYGMFGKGFDTIVSTPFNVSLHDTDCVSCGACVQVCPTGSLMMAERHLTRYAFALDRCIFCGDCVEVCPHGALGETPNFELSFFNRFGEDVTLEKQDLAQAPDYLVRQRLPRSKKSLPVMNPLVRPLPSRGLRE
ncbi:FAD-dependent oxidoreductase [Ktedonobacter racemifer]|uniref:FAD-dependent pyridine nucleotide-disulfide oxidoreductase n=1 Tax=Ktedonobacter racemifer DSM 44963 TaxID=485913 RepID=D6TYJ6_KTERA|nr:FAD-dependent oxidoreductase [Ktedonobacter racemifer]EFH83276.1 FAD-dependent pyridine nucleotide-disulfide oxidoreductase [Ktedonobacter racemifer DSM 44963]